MLLFFRHSQVYFISPCSCWCELLRLCACGLVLTHPSLTSVLLCRKVSVVSRFYNSLDMEDFQVHKEAMMLMELMN